MARGNAESETNSRGVRIVVMGGEGTGKSSLIAAAAGLDLPKSPSSVLPPIRLPDDLYPDRVPVTLVDTSIQSPYEYWKVYNEIGRPDAIVLTYACDNPALNHLTSYWLPKLQSNQEVKGPPIIVVGCKLDLRKNQYPPVHFERKMKPILQEYPEIETCIECSALDYNQVHEVFYHAQKAVLYPTDPLFDKEEKTLKRRYISALTRIFKLSDRDKDGVLSDAELNDFQVKSFNTPLQPSEIVSIKWLIKEIYPQRVNEPDLTLTEFILLHAILIETGRLDITWTALRKFGYNNKLGLSEDNLPPIKRSPDQSVELTAEAVEFLKGVFFMFDTDGDGALKPDELEDLFSTVPESLWRDAEYKFAAERNALGDLPLDGFLLTWALVTILDPVCSLENLICIGYTGDPSSAIRVTRRRCLDCKEKQSDRNVYQCFVKHF